MEISNSDLQSLVDRVERLEEQYRSLKSEVETERLVLVDTDGKTRAALRMFEEEGPGLHLYDTDGNVCAFLKASPEGPSLRLWDSKTEQGLSLRVDDTDGSVARFSHRNGTVIVAAGKNGPAIFLYEEDESISVMVTGGEGGPMISLKNANGTPSVRVTAASSGPAIDLFDAKGEPRLSLHVIQFDSHERGSITIPGLTMRDPNGTPSVEVSALENRPSIGLFDAKNLDRNTSVQITVGKDGPGFVCVKNGNVLRSAP